MRERRSSDWVVDLRGRHELEARFAGALDASADLVLVRRATTSMELLDYHVVGPGDRLAQIELKAKHQSYRGWGELRPDVPEPELFILDELALRKIIDAGRYAFLVVADLPTDRYCVFATLDLVLATKSRAVRHLSIGSGRAKAKVLLDLREAAASSSDVEAAVNDVASMLEVCDRQWSAVEPWPHGPVVQDPYRRSS